MVENTPDDPRQRKPDITKAKELLGWEPKVKLRDGLPLMENDFRTRLGITKKIWFVAELIDEQELFLPEFLHGVGGVIPIYYTYFLCFPKALL